MMLLMMRDLLICIVLVLFSLPLGAQPEATTFDPEEYPTLAALASAAQPSRDRIDLARRLRGVTEIPPPPAAAPTRELGERQMFYVINSSEGSTFQIEATLRAIGQHITLWVEDDAPISDDDLVALAQAFDERVYPEVRGLWGSEASPGVDGDPRIYGLFAFNLGSSAVAYFASDHTYPAAAVPMSNAHEMFFFNLDALDGGYSLPVIESVLSHEFQHMIRSNQHPSLDLWLNEGLSQFTQVYLYGDLGAAALAFLTRPDTQLNTWAEESRQRPAHYGASSMFLIYLYTRYGIDAVQALSADPSERALTALDNVLLAMGEPGANEFFADWVMANVLLDSDDAGGRFGYGELSASFPAAPPEYTASAYPVEYSGSVNQYAADYMLLPNLSDAESLTIRVDIPADTLLIPSSREPGRFWYSNRGDMRDTTLTRAFDLSDTSNATLRYRVWHHTERSWDYGYVLLSADGGLTWEILETEHTTDENPHGAAYGAGYNGVSGGGDVPVWMDETVSLDIHAGQRILLRFEMITDDGVNQPGMAVDDISIAEIGYFSDFEGDDGGWLAEGWLLTDNRLPQEMWLQAAQHSGDDVTVTRWRTHGGGEWQLPLDEGTEQVTLAISPFAPVTTIEMPYTLAFSIE